MWFPIVDGMNRLTAFENQAARASHRTSSRLFYESVTQRSAACTERRYLVAICRLPVTGYAPDRANQTVRSSGLSRAAATAGRAAIAGLLASAITGGFFTSGAQSPRPSDTSSRKTRYVIVGVSGKRAVRKATRIR